MASDMASWRGNPSTSLKGTPSSATRSGRGNPLSVHQAGERSTTTPLLQVEHTDTAVILGGKERSQSRRKQHAAISQAGSLVRCSQDPHSPIWMEGMEYPAQYLVRQTRSMSAKLSDDGKEESPTRIFGNSPVSGKLKTSPEESSRVVQDLEESSRDPELKPLIVSLPITQRSPIRVGIGQEEEVLHTGIMRFFPPCIPTSFHQDFFLPDERFQSLKLQKLRTLQEAKKLKPRGEELVRVKTLRCERLLEDGYSQRHGSDELVQPARHGSVSQPAQQGPDKLLQPAQQGSVKLLQPAQQGPDKLMQPAQQEPDKLLQAAQQGPDKLLQPAQQGSGSPLQPAQQGPDKLLQPAQQEPDKLLQAAQQEPDKLLQPAQQGPDSLQTAVIPDDMSYPINDNRLGSLMCSVYHHHGETSKMQCCASLRCDTGVSGSGG